VHQPEAPADQTRVAKQIADLLRMRVSGDIEILGTPPDHQIAHAAADQVSELTGRDQPIEYLQYIGVDIAARDGMLGAFKNMRFQSFLLGAASIWKARRAYAEAITPSRMVHRLGSSALSSRPRTEMSIPDSDADQQLGFSGVNPSIG